QLAPLHLQQLVSQLGLFLRIGREQLHPLVARLLSTRTDARGEALVHTVRHQELRVLGPAIVPFRRLDLVLAERLAVRAAGVLLVRRAVADMAVHDDHRRPLLFRTERLERPREPLTVIRVTDPRYVPAVADETRRDVV